MTVTVLVDTRANAILDVHVTTARKHDAKIAPSLIKRNSGEVVILLGDTGYDDQKVRALARKGGLVLHAWLCWRHSDTDWCLERLSVRHPTGIRGSVTHD